jgi:hypothetical protein
MKHDLKDTGMCDENTECAGCDIIVCTRNESRKLISGEDGEIRFYDPPFWTTDRAAQVTGIIFLIGMALLSAWIGWTVIRGGKW